MNRVPSASAPPAQMTNWIKTEAFADYGDTEKASWAVQMFQYCLEFSNKPRPSCGEYKSSKQIRKQYKSDLTKYVKEKVRGNPDIKPVGFLAIPIFDLIFEATLGALIGWSVSRFLDVFYPLKDD